MQRLSGYRQGEPALCPSAQRITDPLGSGLRALSRRKGESRFRTARSTLAVDDLEQHVGVTRLVEWTPASQIAAAQLAPDLGERRVFRPNPRSARTPRRETPA
jgi:hypothetical protein